jgi:hypothetical protein
MKRIYFLRPIGAAGPIKIGCSKHPVGRLATVQIWSPLKLEIAASCEGGHDYERALHSRFAKHRLHGEWFEATPDLIALVADVAKGSPLPALPEKAHRMNRDASKEQIDLVARAYVGGSTIKAIGRETGYSYEKIKKLLRGAGIEPVLTRGRVPSWGGVLDLARAAEIATLYRSGLTLQAIGDQYGVSRERIRQILRKTGVPSHGWPRIRASLPVLQAGTADQSQPTQAAA